MLRASGRYDRSSRTCEPAGSSTSTSWYGFKHSSPDGRSWFEHAGLLPTGSQYSHKLREIATVSFQL
jgi:hypothetical protein